MLRHFQRTTKKRLSALDAVRANVMIADTSLTIVYLNPAVHDLLQAVEEDLKKELPRFSMATMIGSNIDIFHKNPTHQRNMLSQLKKSHRATITVGTHVFDLQVTPLMNGRKSAGFVVEWTDAAMRLKNLDYMSQMVAFDRWQAIIEFTLDGSIVGANENFLKLMGYPSEEIVGKHHRIFVDPGERDAPAYAEFWQALKRGDCRSGEFTRVTKQGGHVTIHGSYNPIQDESGRVTKVVKICIDVTKRVQAVNEVAIALSALADGDLERRIAEPLPVELDALRVDFNRALDKLQEAMRAIAANADAVREGAGEITRASDDLSKRTEQQAASLEETAATLDQITATVHKTAEGAVEARSVVNTAKDDAQRSGEVVHEAVTAMQAIENSSGKISNIIGVIDEIAFQTNLLALNAGVEAARAGDAGRGFAVVATEVRALAQRSADAAKEIKALISASGDQVAAGVRLVGLTGEALTRIVGHVDQMSGLMTEIASAAQEQATGLGQVNAAVNQMDKVTQQNAAMVEQSTAASHSLAGEAQELTRLVGQFKSGAAPSGRTARGAASMHTPTPTRSVARPVVDRQKATPPRVAAPLVKRPPALHSPEDNWSEF